VSIKPLKSLCENFKADIVDGPFGSNMKRSDYVEDGIPVLKIQNIKPFMIEIKKMDFVTKAKYTELKRHSYKNGDIVMTKLGDPLGASAIVEGIDEGLIVADLVRIRAKKIDTKYLCYHLNSPITNGFINAQQKGATRPRVQISVVRDLPIYAPPLQEQQRIVAVLDEMFEGIAKAKKNAEQNLRNARELFDSYLQSVFENRNDVWKEKSLEEVCEFRNGAAHEQYIDEDGKYILVNSKFISADGEKMKRTNSALSPLFVNDIAFVMSDVPNGKALAKCFLVDKNDTFTLNQRIGAIRSREFIPKFLVYQFNRNKYLLSFNNGENQTNLRKGDILKCPLFVPSKQDQQAIVAKLDALSAETKRLEAIYQKKIDDLEELKRSILQKAFNGEL